jgi:hypothetical protein
VVSLPITDFVRGLTAATPEDDRSHWLALTAAFERSTFGFMAFGSGASAAPPRLKLIVSAPGGGIQP